MESQIGGDVDNLSESTIPWEIIKLCRENADRIYVVAESMGRREKVQLSRLSVTDALKHVERWVKEGVPPISLKYRLDAYNV